MTLKLDFEFLCSVFLPKVSGSHSFVKAGPVHMNFRVAVVCFAILLPLSVWAGTCRNAQSTAIGGENLVVEVVGPNATIYPPLANGEPNKKSFSFTIDLTMVTERVRGPLNGDPQQSTNDICYTPLSSTGDPTLTPLSEFYRGKPCGELVKYVDLADYDCEADDYETFPAAGVVVKTVKLRMSHPDNPFVYIALFEVPNANLTKETYSDTTHTNGTIYSTYYRYVTVCWKAGGVVFMKKLFSLLRLSLVILAFHCLPVTHF